MNKGTIVRGVLFVLAWVNSFLSARGLKTIPILDETTVATIVTFAISAYTFYTHNVFGKKGKVLENAIVKETEAVIAQVVNTEVKKETPAPVVPTEPVQPTVPQNTQTK